MKKLVLIAVACVTVLWSGAANGAQFRTEQTDLKGSEEAPVPGDPNAAGFATITLSNPGARQICFDLSWQNVSGEDSDPNNDAVTAAHIHEAPAGSAGPVVVGLFMNQALPTTGSQSGCVAAEPSTIAQIRAHTEDYYVNLHSGEYPAGAIRGQLGDAPGSPPPPPEEEPPGGCTDNPSTPQECPDDPT